MKEVQKNWEGGGGGVGCGMWSGIGEKIHERLKVAGGSLIRIKEISF